MSALCEAAQDAGEAISHGIAQIGQGFTVNFTSTTNTSTWSNMVFNCSGTTGGTVASIPAETFTLDTTVRIPGGVFFTSAGTALEAPVREELRAEKIIQVHEYIKSFQRSKKLFREWLSEEEYEVYKKYGRIVIQSKVHVRREYHILAHSPIELTEVYESGEFSYSLCIHDDERRLPKLDRLLSKILLLKADEQQYERTGNRRSMQAYVPMERRLIPIPLLHGRT